jgi:tellurite resistance protein TehA-like permease
MPEPDLGLRLTPAAGAAVMSTGILSTATHMAGLRALSLGLLALAVVGELVLGAGLTRQLLRNRPQVVADAATPASLTGVAATSVIGARVAALGWTGVVWGLLAAAALLWLVLLPLVLLRWQVPTVGASFLVCVATEALAVLAAIAGTGTRPVLVGALAAFLLGLVLYAVVVARFDWRQLKVGAGDHWVLTGALAIAGLAGAELVESSTRGGLLHGLRQPLRVLDLALWVAAVAGYLLLAVCELRWPRPRYDIRRWATVFPMGMTAAATFAVAGAERVPELTVLGHVLLWPGVAAWALVAAGALRRRFGPA